MTNEYDPGDLIRLQGVVKNSAGVATAPTAAVIYVLRADRVLLAYLSSTGWSSQGSWNAETNTPALADGTGTAGHYYTVSAAGAVSLGSRVITFAVGNRVFYDGFYWKKMSGVQTPTLVNPSTGTFYYDYPAPDIPGDYKYALESVGVVKSAERGEFVVNGNGVWP